ncbi:unnamed protein product [Phytomonas sp. Hart1]|nr:unnamed protein product [Phytomonas sp. Hart1]|eukprot:CCW71848.1 unnamed protein product [Phytomonas sp. isolate Hart1]
MKRLLIKNVHLASHCRFLSALMRTSVNKITQRPPPNGFSFNYVLGSRQFSLAKNSEDYSISLFCDVQNIAMKSVGGGVSDKVRPRKRSKTRVTNSQSPQHVYFYTRLKLLHTSFPFHVEVLCHTLLGQLILDSVCFHTKEPLFREGPAKFDTQLSYRGPFLTQSSLVDLLVNQTPSSSPLWNGPQASGQPFDQSSHFIAFQGSNYGHLPVHTVNPALTDKIISFLDIFGIDDDIAEFIQETVPCIQAHELSAWKEILIQELAC